MLHLLTAGSNAQGQLATGTLEDSLTFSTANFHGCDTERVPDTTVEIVDLASGANHTLLLLSQQEPVSKIVSNVLYGSGNGERGQLGPSIARNGLTAIFSRIDLLSVAPELEGYTYQAISAAWETSYIVLSHDTRSDILISMGANDFGDLGVKDDAQPIACNEEVYRVQLGHLLIDGTSLESCHVRFEQIRSGPHHIVAVIRVTVPDDKTRSLTIGWGAARHGQLGGHAKIRQFDIPQILSLDSDDDPIVDIGVGNHHTVLRHLSGRINVYGSSRKAQWNDVIVSLQHVESIGCTWHGTYILCREEDETYIMATGSNTHSQLGLLSNYTRPTLLTNFLEGKEFRSPRITCGSEHVLLWDSTTDLQDDCRGVWGWGWNEHGNLATGSTKDLESSHKIFSSNDNERVVGVWAGCATTWIATRTVL
jgi:protein ATS1